MDGWPCLSIPFRPDMTWPDLTKPLGRFFLFFCSSRLLMPPGLRHAPGMMYIFRSGVRGFEMRSLARVVSFRFHGRVAIRVFCCLMELGARAGWILDRVGVAFVQGAVDMNVDLHDLDYWKNLGLGVWKFSLSLFSSSYCYRSLIPIRLFLLLETSL